MKSISGSDISRSRLFRDRVLFFVGILLSVVGGPILALGSFAHDRYNIPVIGEAYDAFGWLNTAFLIGGVAVLFAGLGLVAFSLRGGLVTGHGDLEGL
jgi:hypothetical protein